MIIAELLKGLSIKSVTGTLNREIKGIAYDSRLVKKDFIFVAIKGLLLDGHDYIEDAINRGATGVISERSLNLQADSTFVEVNDTREALALLSSAFYREPSRDLTLIGITGTNGKTTTSYIIKSILEAWGKRVGLLGTINYIINKDILPAPHTTPESLELQRYLREMVDNGIGYGVIEVSSHALSLERIKGCSFKVGVFTNFSQDHLDFHKTMQGYFEAKSRLFDYVEEGGYAVLNWDDIMVRNLKENLHCNVLTCGLEEGAMIRAVDVKVQSAKCKMENCGISFKIQTPKGIFDINSPLVGRNNVYNITMAIGAAYALGIDKEAIIRGIMEVKPVEGRFEKIDAGQDFLCIVDYAHTEDALKKLIEEARLITHGRVITVFGCGGDRDKTKRPVMGMVATELSDIAIITSDNPRTEEPSEIIKDILGGIRESNYIVEPDRAKAIGIAVSLAEPEDTVLIAGKGHEDYQEIKGVRHHFSDKEVIRKAIKQLGSLSKRG